MNLKYLHVRHEDSQQDTLNCAPYHSVLKVLLQTIHNTLNITAPQEFGVAEFGMFFTVCIKISITALHL